MRTECRKENFAELSVGCKTVRRATGQLNSVSPEARQKIALEKKLFVSLLMAVLSQSFFTLVRRNLMTLSFLTTRHTQVIF